MWTQNEWNVITLERANASESVAHISRVLCSPLWRPTSQKSHPWARVKFCVWYHWGENRTQNYSVSDHEIQHTKPQTVWSPYLFPNVVVRDWRKVTDPADHKYPQFVITQKSDSHYFGNFCVHTVTPCDKRQCVIKPWVVLCFGVSDQSNSFVFAPVASQLDFTTARKANLEKSQSQSDCDHDYDPLQGWASTTQGKLHFQESMQPQMGGGSRAPPRKTTMHYQIKGGERSIFNLAPICNKIF